MNTEYEKLDFKIPKELPDYQECSDYVVGQIESIIREAIELDKNKIIINTSLKLGLPMENINKVIILLLVVDSYKCEIFIM